MLRDEDAANGEMPFPVMIRGEAIHGVSPTYCVPVIAIYLLLLYYDCCVDIMRAEGCRGTSISISLNSGWGSSNANLASYCIGLKPLARPATDLVAFYSANPASSIYGLATRWCVVPTIGLASKGEYSGTVRRSL